MRQIEHPEGTRALTEQNPFGVNLPNRVIVPEGLCACQHDHFSAVLLRANRNDPNQTVHYNGGSANFR
jgi:hypothetical protein